MTPYSTYQSLIEEERYQDIFKLFDNERAERLVTLLVEKQLFLRLNRKHTFISGKKRNEITQKFWNKFWQDYIIDSPHSSTIFNSQFRLLAKHFEAIDKPDPDFIERIAEKFPIPTINAIRLSRKFIEKNFLAEIGSLERSSNIYLQKHYALFRKFHLKEKYLWDNATQDIKRVSLNSIQWLYILFLHFQWHKHKNRDEETYVMVHYINDFIHFQSYSTIFSYILIQNDDKSHTKSSVVQSLRELLTSPENIYQAIGVLQKWVEWHSFVHKELDQYCFNLNYEVHEISDEVITIAPKDIYKQSLRYSSIIRQSMFFAKIRNHAFIIQRKVMTEQLDNIGDNNISLIERLKEFVKIIPIVSNYSEAYFLSLVYCLDPKEAGLLDKLLLIVSTLQAEAMKQYAIPLQKIRAEDFDSWLIDLHNVTKEYISTMTSGANPFPLFLLSENIFKDNLDTDFFEEVTLSNVLDLFVYNASNFGRPFNRFNPFFNFYETPFIQFGQVITGIKTLLSAQDPGILALETFMKSDKARGLNQLQESSHFETLLKDYFFDIGFQNIFLNVKINNAERTTFGEIDLLIIEDNECLLIEVKRTRLPITGYELFLDEEYTLRKASEQLARCRKILETDLPYVIQTGHESDGITCESFAINKGMNFHGCIISMHCNMDSVSFGDGIYKTSFAEMILGDFMQHCKTAKGNKVNAFMELISTPYLPVGSLYNPKTSFKIKI